MPEVGDRIVLLGWYGSDNMGDEALLQVIVKALHARGFNNLVALSTDPRQTGRTLGIKSVGRNLFRLSALRELVGAKALILGGGGLIQDGTSVYNLPIYAVYVAMARLLGLNVVGWGLGAELIRTRLGKMLARFICRSSRHFSLRDTASKRALVRAGVSSGRLKVTADPAMMLEPEDHQRSWPDEGKPTIIFCIRQLPVIRPGMNLSYFLPVSLRHRLRMEWKQTPGRVDNLVETLAQGIRIAVDEMGAQVVLLPLWPGRDDGMIDIVEAAALMLNVPQEAMRRADLDHKPGQYLSYIGKADLLVSMRLHALIFASLQGVPSLALSYAGKVRGFMRELDAERWVVEIERRTPPPEELAMKLRQLWQERELEGERLHRSASRACQAAEADADEIAELLR